MKKIKHDYKISFLLLIIGTTMIISGVIIGEPKIVLEKAIKICMECVGIG